MKKIYVSVMAALICIFTQLLKVVQRTTKWNFFRDPMGLKNHQKNLVLNKNKNKQEQ